jgi:hypothetical protein
MKTNLVYKQELIDVVEGLPKKMAKEVVDFAKYLRWQNVFNKSFAERVDALWVELRKQAEKSKYNQKDISKLICEVRKKK